jgi:hypothetical protein
MTRVISTMLILYGLQVQASLKIYDLNTHGYHPMNEAPRYFQDHSGKTTKAKAHLFYFDLAELERGLEETLQKQARDIQTLQPDIIVLQEVASGHPQWQKSCQQFETDSGDQFGTNTAYRLAHKLRSQGVMYFAHVSCRGNTGWITNHETFKDKRIVKKVNGQTRIVFDYHENPYPDGLLTEGFAVLLKDSVKFIEQMHWKIEYNDLGHNLHAQAVKFKKNNLWYLVLNIHAGHKVAHFEQAVALRQQVATYLSSRKDLDRFGGVIYVGDFNAKLYRPKSAQHEPSMIAWQAKVAGQYDYTQLGTVRDSNELYHLLWNLNWSNNYKPWATIRNKDEAHWRIETAIDDFLLTAKRKQWLTS